MRASVGLVAWRRGGGCKKAHLVGRFNLVAFNCINACFGCCPSAGEVFFSLATNPNLRHLTNALTPVCISTNSRSLHSVAASKICRCFPGSATFYCRALMMCRLRTASGSCMVKSNTFTLPQSFPGFQGQRHFGRRCSPIAPVWLVVVLVQSWHRVLACH